jgi:phage tail tape-measure protein
LFLGYLNANDFPGADMARKFLQMGWTRARRYANHKTGRKFVAAFREPRHTKDRRDSMAAESIRNVNEGDANEDPITGEPGAHPIGAGLGAAAGGAAVGATAGAVAGPVGTVAGAVIGGVAGGLAGKAVAESIDPTTEENHWRQEYPNREYYDETVGYEEVGPAYRYGWESRAEHQDRDWNDVEPELEKGWTRHRGESSLEWDQARRPTRDAWERIDSGLAEERDNQSAPPRLPK